MNRVTKFDIYPDNGGFRVWDADLDPSETYHEVNDQTLCQGFSSRLGRSINFSTLGECFGMTIEVWYADHSDKVQLRDDTIRAILVPFSTSGWWKIGDLSGEIEVSLSACSGHHALLYEVKLSDNDEYLNSSRYQENLEEGFTEERCYLTLYPRDKSDEPVRPEILRIDAWTSPPYELACYDPIHPIYPLLMEVGLA